MKCLEIWASYSDSPRCFVKMCSFKVDQKVDRLEVKLIELEK